MTLNAVASFSDLERLLGGREAARTALGATCSDYATWKHRGGIPPRYFHSHREILRNRELVAAPAMWGQTPARAALAPATKAPARLQI